MTDKSRPADGRAVIQVEMPRSTHARRPEIRHHSADRQSGDVTRRPVGLRIVIGRQPQVCVCPTVAAAAAAVDGVRTKSSQSTSCQCDRLAWNTLRVWTSQRKCFSGTENLQSCLQNARACSRAGVPAPVDHRSWNTGSTAGCGTWPHLGQLGSTVLSIAVVYCCRVGGSVAEWMACWTQAQKGPGSNRSRDTLSGNSLRQTVHTNCAAVHQAAKLVAALLRVA